MKQQYADEQENSKQECYDDRRQHLDEQKILRFYQAFDRLTKFVEDSKSVKLDENDILSKYIKKFQKFEKTRKIVEITHQDVLKLVEEKVERMAKSQKIKKNWSSEDRKILHWIVTHYAKMMNFKNIEKQFTQYDWNYIASIMPGFTANECMFKWLGFHKINLNEANWSEQESEILKTLVAKFVNVNKAIGWKDVCKKLYLLNQNAVRNFRTPKQCKEHWNFRLNPNLRREPWTQQEDITLLKTIKQNSGLKKWVQMVKLFDGRTQNAVKNRFNLIIEKQKKYRLKEADELDLIETYLQRCYIQKYTKIIEPDSQQIPPTGQQIVQGLNLNKKMKTKRFKRQSRNPPVKRQILVKTQPKLEYIIQFNPILKESFQQQVKAVQNHQAEYTTETIKQQHELHAEELISIQNFPQISTYNHRSNDFQYNFMYMDSI